MAAAAFHIGGYAARAYSLFEGDLRTLNLSSYETALVHLMRRNLPALRRTFVDWLSDEGNSDEGVLRRLQGERIAAADDDFGADDVVAMALTRHFHRTIATYEHAIVTGSDRHFRTALAQFFRGEQASLEAKHIPLWWSFRVARHLCDDTWKNSLRVVLPKDGGPPRWTELREQFIKMLIERETAEIDLWPSQVGAAARVVIPDYRRLQSWIRRQRKDLVEGPTWPLPEDEREWSRFLARFEHRNFGTKKPKTMRMSSS
jgi:hypothetical protein